MNMESDPKDPNGKGRGRNFDEIKRDLSQSLLALKKPTDFITTLIYCIPILAPVRICLEAKIVQQLADRAPNPLTSTELSETLDSSNGENKEETRDFVVRMMRAVCALGLVDESAPFTYRANELTKILADPGFTAGFQLIFDNAMGPLSTMSQMRSYHTSNGWKAPPSATDGPWQRAHGTEGTSTFDSWIRDDPKQLERLSSLMQRMQRDRPHWTEWLPEDILFQDITGPLVDVGGGRGHDFGALAAKYPNRELALIVQDLESVIEEGEKMDERLTFEAHNFFEPQPVKNASVYYMHKIMHDWPDSECVKILSHLRDAMGERSRILINDVILPNTGSSLLHSAFDIDMLALHSGLERDEQMWHRLINKVEELQIRNFWHPPNGDGEGIVEIVRSLSNQ